MLLRMSPRAYWTVMLDALKAPITHLLTVRRCLSQNSAFIQGGKVAAIQIYVTVNLVVTYPPGKEPRSGDGPSLPPP